uniref:Leucine-rich repeat-containing N-terminal plant-type domain-containing protein n=1 Tax=Gossypium raimondii TaxID=29730 RepID=A0A0D2VM08_GOSRA|nr:hypothetical protein B456_N026100 [Gossypium raimondii]
MYNLTRLRILDLSRNHLSGPIPFDFPSLLNLEQLNISFNMFGGPIPSTISNLTRLTILDIFTNYLSGDIPSDMFERLSKLQVLDLVSAWIPTSIPMSLFKCKELQIMNLVDCGFEGILPKEIGNLTMLRSLDLTYNEIEAFANNIIICKMQQSPTEKCPSTKYKSPKSHIDNIITSYHQTRKTPLCYSAL